MNILYYKKIIIFTTQIIIFFNLCATNNNIFDINTLNYNKNKYYYFQL